MPGFVFHYLDELLLVTFNSMDALSLQERIEKLRVDVCAMRYTMKVQTNFSDDLHVSTVNLN